MCYTLYMFYTAIHIHIHDNYTYLYTHLPDNPRSCLGVIGIIQLVGDELMLWPLGLDFWDWPAKSLNQLKGLITC